MLKYYRKLLKDFEQIQGTVIVYGSVAKEKSRPESDIDIAVISANEEMKKLAKSIANDLLHKEGRVITIVFFTPKELITKKTPFIEDVLKGEIIHGGKELEQIGEERA